jgi:hypothetical protein
MRDSSADTIIDVRVVSRFHRPGLAASPAMLQFYRMMHAPHRATFWHIRVPGCASSPSPKAISKERCARNNGETATGDCVDATITELLNRYTFTSITADAATPEFDTALIKNIDEADALIWPAP